MFLLPLFYYWYNEKKGLEELNATVQWTVAADGGAPRSESKLK